MAYHESLFRYNGGYEKCLMITIAELSQELQIALIGEWFYYNFAAGSFHTKKLCSRIYTTELEFYSQKRRELGITYALHL